MRKRRIHRTGPLQAGFRVQRANGKSRLRRTVQGAHGRAFERSGARGESGFDIEAAFRYTKRRIFAGRFSPVVFFGRRRSRTEAVAAERLPLGGIRKRYDGAAEVWTSSAYQIRRTATELSSFGGAASPGNILWRVKPPSSLRKPPARWTHVCFLERNGGLRAPFRGGLPGFLRERFGVLAPGRNTPAPADRQIMGVRLFSQPIDVLSETHVVVLPGRLLPFRTDFLRGRSGYAVCGRESCGRIRKPSLETAVHRKMQMLAAGRSACLRIERRTGRYDMR